MRISTASVYQNATNNFNDLQSAIAHSTGQVSSGKSLTAPADDPTAAAEVLIASQASAINTQFGVNRSNLSGALNGADGVLAGVTNTMQSLSSQIVAANNGTLNAADRSSIAQQLQSGLDQLMSLANSTDSNGNYMFSGTAVGTPAYSVTSNGAVYNGNQSTQMLQVNTSQQLAVTQVGSAVFGNISVSPNAYFSTPSAGNSSTATMSNGTVVTPSALTNDSYSIAFTSPSAYSVMDTSTGATVSSNNTYTSGAAIVVAGVQFSVTNGSGATGVPAAGDQFSVQPGKQNIFQVLASAITALKQPATTSAASSNLANVLAQANTGIASSLNNILTARDQIGNALQQSATYDSVGSTVGLSLTTTISNLQDTKYAEVISQLSQEQFTYKAAQQVFAATSSLSLISLLR